MFVDDVNWNEKALIGSSPETMLKEMLENANNLLKKNREILEDIKKDQDTLAREKKKLRLEDKKYYKSLTPDFLEFLVPEKKLEVDKLNLETGRPRMDPQLVYLFIVIRGYYGSVTNQKAFEQILDSRTIDAILQGWNLKMPGRTTILENLNAISNETREKILNAQIEEVKEEGLDDFKECQIDSTSVKGNTEWPTDAGILLALLTGTCNLFKKLVKFGIDKFKAGWTWTWIENLAQLLYKINTTAGKPKSKRKIEKFYSEFLKTAKKINEHLIKEKDRIKNQVSKIDLAPSIMLKLNAIWDKINSQIIDIVNVLYYAQDRILNGVVLKATEKILSISDRTAAYIKKGDREDVIGYKPQIAKSGNGFITSVTVPKGNASDSGEFEEVVEDVIKRTKVIPIEISVDDGYASKRGKENVEKLGVKRVSIGGSKGKKLTGDEEYDSEDYKKARAKRSGIESVIYVLKYVFEFGQLKRRGIEAVESELLEKVVAYNFKKKVEIVRREEKEKQKARENKKSA